METAIFRIDDMSCGHCVMRVQNALSNQAGIARAEVEIGQARISFDQTQISESDIIGLIDEAGYPAFRAE